MAGHPLPSSHAASARARRAIDARASQCTRDLRAAMAALKSDIAQSFRICSREFGALGQELVTALEQGQQRQRGADTAVVQALAFERTARRRLQSKVTELQGRMRVVCRVRPLTAQEAADPQASIKVQVPSTHDVHVQLGADESLSKSFSMERVFGEETTQQQLYKEIAPLVSAAVDGQHACVFAYGQTSSGKTHTMLGAPTDRGVVQRAAETIFELTKEQQQAYAFTVTLQAVEVYNEEIYDLLASSRAQSTLSTTSSATATTSSTNVLMPFQPTHGPSYISQRPLGEIRHGDQGVYLRNVVSISVQSAEDVQHTLEMIEQHRVVQGASNVEHCNRSHCILVLDIQRCSRGDGLIEQGRLVLVDLAGSERLLKTEASPQLVREMGYISKSLSAINDVMVAISTKEKHVPFRNSKLTHMLQDSLGATDGHTLVIVHVNPTNLHVNETINTLKFAARLEQLQNATTRRSERLELTRLQGIITMQATQLQTLQDKLAGELELRRKYEKRLEDYRQEDHRRRAKDDEKSKKEVPSASPQRDRPSSEQPYATRRWSMNRKETFKNTAGNPPLRVHNARGQENIAENIMRANDQPSDSGLPPLPAPMRRSRRLSLMEPGEKSSLSPPKSPPASSKRKTTTSSSPAEVRSILKKQRMSLDPGAVSDTAARRVSFDVRSQLAGPKIFSKQGTTPPLGLPPRQPSSAPARTPVAASRVPMPATRVRIANPDASTSPGRTRSPLRAAARPATWKAGWR